MNQQNEFTNPAENSAPLYKRLYTYQKERFPLLGHGLLVAAFSFSAISYSRICRGESGFVPWPVFAMGIFTTITLFMLVRIFDEFKDAEEDAEFRKHLPMPRGLIKFSELKTIGIIIAIAQIAVNAWFFPKMLLIYAIVIGYLLLMGKEFFIVDWLKAHPFWYVTSHMLIIPLIDIYASGLDWLLSGASAPKGLLFFFAVSFMNGIVLEIGRKIKSPDQEATGVNTYTAMLGTDRAVWLWLAVLLATLLLAIAAVQYAGYGLLGWIVLGFVFLICATPAIGFLKEKSGKMAKYIEYSSALWTISMYLTLGGAAMLSRLF
jgi:4-hydroxybenzoate polyprenyltransferase